MRVKCPHCSQPARIRSSKEITSTTRELRLQCQNVECAHTWVAVFSAMRTIAPSMTPNRKVYIPLSPKSPAANPPAGNQLELGMEHPSPRLAPSG